MASLLRNIARQGCQLVARNNVVYRQNIHPRLLISTSRKNKDAASISNHDEPVKVEENLADKEENWISYGYSLTDKKEDAWANNLIMFVIITVGLCWGSFIVAYMPDHKMRDWAQREAFLELARRENDGLPLIDRNLIDPAKIDLPPDEELADDEIII